MYWYEHGQKIIPPALAALLVMPLILSGLWLGLHLGKRLSKARFRRITFSLILLIATFAIGAPLLTSPAG